MSDDPHGASTGAQTTIPGIESLDGELDASLDLARQRMRALLVGGSPEVFVGRYRLIERVGSGAMGQIWRARDDELARDVAIKLLKSGRHSPADVERLAHEARSLARLSHPNVVEVFDLGAYDDPGHGPAVFLAMAFVEGQTLRQWARAPGRTWQERIDALLAAGRGLAAAHAIGLVHRDFKPDNVMVARNGRVLVADFGLARLRRGPAQDHIVPLVDSARAQQIETLGGSLTESGAVVGTPVYMTPEQLTGREADVAADVYAWCASAYEVLCGVLPFRGSLDEIVRAKWTASLARPHQTPPAAVMAVLLRGLAPEPTRRWPSIDAAMDALARTTRRRRWARPVAALVGIAAVAAAIGSSRREPPLDCVAITWDAGAWASERDAAHDAVATAKNPGAAAALTQVLDRRAREIVGGAERACAERGRAHNLSCWRDAAAELRAIAARLRDPTLRPEAIEEIRASLDGATTCPDEGDTLVPPPEVADVIDGLSAELATARVERRSGLMSDALARIDRVVQACERDVQWPPFTARARFERGLTVYALDDVGGAQDDLSRAHFLAAAAGDHRLAFDAAIELVFTAVGERRPTLGNEWLRHAESALARATPSAEASAMRSSARAELALVIDDLEAAALAVANGERICGDADCGLARPRLEVSRNNVECVRKTPRCVELLLAAEHATIDRFGADSARAADAGIETVQGLLFVGRAADAIAHAEEVEARGGAMLEARSFRRARLLGFRATALAIAERCVEAKIVALDALAIADAQPSAHELRFYERAVANAALCSDDFVLAIAIAERGLAWVEEGQPALVADFRVTQAAAYLGLGRHDAALAALHDARQLVGQRPSEAAQLDVLEAMVMREQGRESEALALEQRARSQMSAVCGAAEVVILGGRAECAAP